MINKCFKKINKLSELAKYKIFLNFTPRLNLKIILNFGRNFFNSFVDNIYLPSSID